MSIPKEPRQLMINLMYLVLTALLALNVTNEVLNAFKTIQKSIVKSNTAVDKNSGNTYLNFQAALDDPKMAAEKKPRIAAAKLLADEVRTNTTSMVKMLEMYRDTIYNFSGGKDPEKPTEMKDQANLDAATAIMIENHYPTMSGDILLKAMQAFKTKLASFVPNDNAKNPEDFKVAPNPDFEKSLPLDFNYDLPEDVAKGSKEDTWAFANFHMSPAIASTTILDKYISDVRASEAASLEKIWAQCSGEKKIKQLVFSDYALMMSADNNYLLPGETFKAHVMIGAYNKTNNRVTINVNGQGLNIKDGMGEYTTTASGEGEKKLSISGTYFDPNANGGEGANKPIEAISYSFFVGAPAASISLDKMNVFYKGVDNPITMSASGIPLNKLVPTPSNCTLKPVAGTPGAYTVDVMHSTGPEATISLSGTTSDGKTQSFGVKKYRIKRLPDPTMKFAGKSGQGVRADIFRVQLGLIPEMGADFVYDIKYNVISFKTIIIPKKSGEEMTFDSPGPLISSNPVIQASFNKLKAGDRVIFEDVIVKGPDGVNRQMPSLSFNLF